MSATGYVPPTIPSVETGIPPREWSESILASNTTASDAPAETSEGQGSKEATMKDQPSIGETVVQTAKQYVPKQVGKMVNYAAQTAAAAVSYLSDPQGIKNTTSPELPSEGHATDPHVSLPSTELKGAQPSERTGGVGALPGNLSESSVALLPEERDERAQEGRQTQRRDTIRPSVTSGEIETEPRRSEKGEATESTAPSKDEPGVSQITRTTAPEIVESGAPAISTLEVESQKGVSETKGQQVSGELGDPVAIAGGEVHSAKELGEKGQEASEGSNLVPKHGEKSQEEGERQAFAAKKVEETYGGDYHPALLHPPPPGASVAEYDSSPREPQEKHDDSPTDNKRASVGAERKPGFMTMVKGEMKIIAGKMSGDEQKVEEGKKLIHGEM